MLYVSCVRPVRLLKAFQIDFSWYRLSSWINLTEQWPLRASMIVLQHDQKGESLDDNMSLQAVYEKFVHFNPLGVHEIKQHIFKSLL